MNINPKKQKLSSSYFQNPSQYSHYLVPTRNQEKRKNQITHSNIIKSNVVTRQYHQGKSAGKKSYVHYGKSHILYRKTQKPEENNYGSTQVDKHIVEENARLISQRQALFRKNCQLVNEIKNLKKYNQIGSTSKVIKSRKLTYQENNKWNSNYSDQIAQISQQDQFLMNQFKNNGYKSNDNLRGQKYQIHRDPQKISSTPFRPLSPKFSDYNNSQGQQSQEHYFAQQTTPFQRNLGPNFQLMKNKSSKCMKHRNLWNQAQQTKKPVYTNNSSIKNSQTSKYVLVKMCQHCADQLDGPYKNSYPNYPYAKQKINKRSFQPVIQIKQSAKKKTQLQLLQQKIKRIKQENNMLRNQLYF